MKISKTHQRLANSLQEHYRISNQDVLDHPENYLGPNWEALINFWLYLDTLTEEQLKVVDRRSSIEEIEIACNKAWNSAESTTEYVHIVASAAYYSVSYVDAEAQYATLEIVGIEKLLEQGHQPIFFPMFLNL
jgi:hypothetical protein